LDKVTVAEVTDDLLRQITSDPFLDLERRNKLQTQVLDVKTAGLQAEEAMSEEEAIVSVAGSKVVEAIDKFSILSLIAAITTSIITAIGFVSLGWLIDLYKSAVDIINWSLPILVAIITVIGIILTWFIMGTKVSGKT
jgi:sensor histidine kinase regulating citrate/malate metabolism